MNVLVVADVSPLRVLGGGERVLGELACGLSARGHGVRIVCRAPEGEPERADHQGVLVRQFPVDRRSLLRFIRSSILQARRAVTEEIESQGADVLHLHQPLSALGALLSPAGRRLPSLYTFHSSAPLEYRSRQGTSTMHRSGPAGVAAAAVLHLIERAALVRATRVHVLSEFSAGLLWKLYRIRGERVVRIPGGVDVERFRPPADRVALRQSLGLPLAGPVLLTVRNLEPRMGLDTLLEALDSVRRRRPDVLLLVGGAGSQRARLEAIIARLGLAGHVRLLGFVPDADLPRYYGGADAFLLPTRELEGFGLVTVEALACGTPVLGTPVGATPELLAALDPSLIFRAMTPECMADDLERFLDGLTRDPEAAERRRLSCRRHAETYRWERSVAGVERVLTTLQTASARAAVGSHCAVCGAATRGGAWYRSRQYRLCSRCGTAVAPVLPEPARVREVYEREYPRQFAPERIVPARRALFAALLERLARLTASRRLLDLGCGGGHLLVTAEERGWRCVGTDVARPACTAALKAAGRPVVQADSAAVPLRDGEADAVTLVNVLDHVVDPARVLAEAHRVLTDGGVLVVRVPNGAFHRACLRAVAWLGPLGRMTALGSYPVFHLFSFTAAGLRHLVAATGFEVVEVRNSPLSAEGPEAADAPPHRLSHALRALLGGATGAVARLSAGRWLLAPSIELYARRPTRPVAVRAAAGGEASL
jgi:glycosyltransferase involved in cell wall biosynthesis/SAM-dependent methyltransferase